MAQPKTTLYVGGLDEQVTEAVLHAAFVPFGDLKDVNIPLDHQTQKNRGFGFVTFVEKEDAAEAMYNMHNGELFGRVLRCNYAQAPRGGSAGGTRPAWEDADAYAAAAAAREEEEEEEEDEKEGGKGDAMAGLEANVD